MKLFLSYILLCFWILYSAEKKEEDLIGSSLKNDEADNEAELISSLVTTYEQTSINNIKIEKKEEQQLNKYNKKLYKHLSKLQTFDNEIEQIKQEKKKIEEESPEIIVIPNLQKKRNRKLRRVLKIQKVQKEIIEFVNIILISNKEFTEINDFLD